MCNYFLDNFATYNNDQDSIGYEVYDPIEYGEELNIKSPLPIYQPKIEKMCVKILSHIELPLKKDDAWWKDLDLTKKNLLNKGFCPDSAFHIEIIDEKIVKAYPNDKIDDTLRDRSFPQECINCKHGFYSKEAAEKDREILINIIKDYGY